jgi:hypothetical protein
MVTTGQPNAAGGDDQEIPREFIFLMTDEHTLRQRMEEEPYLLFVTAFDSAIREYFGSTPKGPGFDLQAECALLPGHRKLLEVQVQPDDVARELIEGLLDRLGTLPCPRVRRGPVSFFVRSMIWGGRTAGEGGFYFPFRQLLAPLAAKRGGATPVDELLMEAAGLGSASETLWSRLKRLLGSG